ncbi:MAG: SAM-dependent methyltransferase [Actinomycetota bacterium]|nr:SAM-dependent methyltransferase [Actinomycetota bacterium]
MQLALYEPELGFYARGGGVGRGKDFLTSPELGPLFGAVVARALDRWWNDLGRPDPFFVMEAGAGIGALAAAVVAAAPACAPALRYLLVERSEVLRERQRHRLPLEPARQVLGPMLSSDPEDAPQPAPGSGPLLTSLAGLPAGPLVGVVLANELLDNLPFRLLERSPKGWAEVRVDAELAEVLVPTHSALATEATRLAPDAQTGARIPLQREAARWLRGALRSLRRGRVIVVDYATTTAALAGRPWTDWVRTYRAHGRGGPPLAALGEQDITCEVAVDQLTAVRAVTADRSQAEFLAAHGLEELVETARRQWQERAAVGDLQALRARSRTVEAAALTDNDGLGSFRVLEWNV